MKTQTITVMEQFYLEKTSSSQLHQSPISLKRETFPNVSCSIHCKTRVLRQVLRTALTQHKPLVYVNPNKLLSVVSLHKPSTFLNTAAAGSCAPGAQLVTEIPKQNQGA
jgi:hypothetical protein